MFGDFYISLFLNIVFLPNRELGIQLEIEPGFIASIGFAANAADVYNRSTINDLMLPVRNAFKLRYTKDEVDAIITDIELTPGPVGSQGKFHGCSSNDSLQYRIRAFIRITYV